MSFLMRRTVSSLFYSRSFSTSGKRAINPLIDGILEKVSEDDEKKPNKRKNHLKNGALLGSERQGNNDGSNSNNDNNQHDYDENPSYWERIREFGFKCLETSGITFASLAVLGGAGFAYHKFYDVHVLDKMSDAFNKGDDAFELTMHKRTTEKKGDWIERPQQVILDDIIAGNTSGRYFLVSGEKGCGKSSMILDSIKKVDGFNCSYIDAHSDPEIFRIRLGKALDFAYHEDYIGSLFSIRGPRDTTALLDIERAFNKLEEVAVKRVKKYGKPLVLIINNSHLIKDDEEGSKLVELLQQKAESLSGAGLVTMIFNSDDYWLYERLKRLGTRLEVINVRDFNREQSLKALSLARKKFFNEDIDPVVANQVYDLIGGRAQHISEVAKNKDLIQASHKLIDREKTWYLNQCGLLGSGMDDDVNESGKFSTSAMILMKEFVDMYHEDKIAERNGDLDQKHDHRLPELPLWRARQIMTRNDYIQAYDNLNIFAIDSQTSFVRADSVPMMRGFLEIAAQKGFDDLLNETIDRVGEIESLGRTRELVAKDLVLGGHYKFKPSKNEGSYSIQLHQKDDPEDDNEEPIKLQPTSLHGNKSFWKDRLNYKISDSEAKQD